MSRDAPEPLREPLIALTYRAYRAMVAEMISAAHRAGHDTIKQTHNAVFATLTRDGMRTVDMASKMGVTRQSMGEIIREMVDLGLLELRPDPTDRRAKLVTYTHKGRRVATGGLAHIHDLERRFTEEFGQHDYEIARRVLERVTHILEEA